MKDNYTTVLAKNILNNIKQNVKNNNIYLSKDKEIETDKKMLEVIKSIILNGKENIFEKNKINYTIMSSLIQYYVAIYNDNLDLLHKLLDKGFKFGNYEYREMSLFVLDKNISSKFDLNEYIDLLEDNFLLLKNFYSSLNIKDEERELNKLKEKFCNIIKKDKNIAASKIYNKSFVYNSFNSLLNVNILNNFSEEEILNLTDTQKEVLDDLYFIDNEITQLKINLIKNYNFSKNLIAWSCFNRSFTIEEISKLTDNDINLINCIHLSIYKHEDPRKIEKIAIEKFKQIKKINPDFNIELDSFAYSVLSVNQISKITESCAERINRTCSLYIMHNEVSEKQTKLWIKEIYYKDAIKRNLKKLVKTK